MGANKLHIHNCLSILPTYVEFQEGRTIVCVLTPNGERQSIWVDKADLIFDELDLAIPDVLSFVEQRSRTLIPEFWHAHDIAGTAKLQLGIWCIWIDPSDSSASYAVGCNFDFNCEAFNLPELPDDEYISIVDRDAAGNLQVVE